MLLCAARSILMWSQLSSSFRIWCVNANLSNEDAGTTRVHFRATASASSSGQCDAITLVMRLHVSIKLHTALDDASTDEK
jgi:hypothetical protein